MGKLYDELKKRDSTYDSRILNTLYGWICIEPESSSCFATFSRGEILSCIDRQIEHIRFRSKAQVGDKITKTENGFTNLSQLNRVAKPSMIILTTVEDTTKDENKSN